MVFTIIKIGVVNEEKNPYAKKPGAADVALGS
jgi:hypothetical protein